MLVYILVLAGHVTLNENTNTERVIFSLDQVLASRAHPISGILPKKMCNIIHLLLLNKKTKKINVFQNHGYKF